MDEFKSAAQGVESGDRSLYNENAMGLATATTPETSVIRRAELPVTVIAMPVKAVRPESSMSVLMGGLARFSLVPVVDKKKKLVGVIRDQDVLISHDFEATGLSGHLHATQVASLAENATIEEALALFGEVDQSLIPIVDAKGRYSGQCASRGMLYKLLHGMLKPARIGGLATPLGVYMTSGYYSSGAGWKGLVATGMLFGLIVHLLDRLGLVAYSAAITLAPGLIHLDSSNQMILESGLMIFCLLGLLRLSPMSGLHAAEHMTINAIENDLPLTESSVRTQPREHMRCGTNLMVLLGGLQLVGATVLTSWNQMTAPGLFMYVSFWIYIILKYWKPAGLWLQRHFTTRHPSSPQLASGIKAGQELLEKYAARPHPTPGFWLRIWGSGLPQMLCAFSLTAWLLGFLFDKLGI